MNESCKYDGCSYADVPDSHMFCQTKKFSKDLHLGAVWVFIMCLFLDHGMLTPHCPCRTLLPSCAIGMTSMVLSVKCHLFMGKSCLLDKAVYSRTV